MLRVNTRLWVISDTHFGHKNIVQFQQRPDTHEVIMLWNWITRVGEDDQILHLGDVFMGKGGNPEKWAAVLSRMPGEKYLILGNHDRYPRRLYEHAGFTILEPFAAQCRGTSVAFTHRPITDLYPGPEGDYSVNVHGHIHNNTWEQGLDEDGYPLASLTHVNVSVEVTGLAPVQLGNLLGRMELP